MKKLPVISGLFISTDWAQIVQQHHECDRYFRALTCFAEKLNMFNMIQIFHKNKNTIHSDDGRCWELIFNMPMFSWDVTYLASFSFVIRCCPSPTSFKSISTQTWQDDQSDLTLCLLLDWIVYNAPDRALQGAQVLGFNCEIWGARVLDLKTSPSACVNTSSMPGFHCSTIQKTGPGYS